MHTGSARPSTLTAILNGLCPRCRSAPIFRGSRLWLTPMHERCPVCDLRFEREPGYFLGAMYIGYGLALSVITLFSAILFFITRLHLRGSLVGGVLMFLPFAPLLTHMARVLWIYFDQWIDPDKS